MRRTEDGAAAGVVISRYFTIALDCVYLAPLLTSCVTYPLGIASGRVYSGDFFISSSIDDNSDTMQGFAHRVGGVGLCITAQALGFTILAFYLIRLNEASTVMSVARAHNSHSKQTNELLDAVTRVRSLNMWATIFGVLCCVGIICVALFNASFNIKLHLSWAFLAFFDGILFILWQSRIDATWTQVARDHDHVRVDAPMIDQEPNIVRFRLALCAVAMASLLGMFGIFPLSKAISSAFELIMVATLFAYFSTWRTRLHALVFRMCIDAVESAAGMPSAVDDCMGTPIMDASQADLMPLTQQQ